MHWKRSNIKILNQNVSLDEVRNIISLWCQLCCMKLKSLLCFLRKILDQKMTQHEKHPFSAAAFSPSCLAVCWVTLEWLNTDFPTFFLLSWAVGASEETAGTLSGFTLGLCTTFLLDSTLRTCSNDETRMNKLEPNLAMSLPWNSGHNQRAQSELL